MKTIVIIGKNFGDEGKGLATDFFSSSCQNALVVRTNGGAQSGHTVEKEAPQKRFVFHELSSGSFNGASTLWADSFYPDLLKLHEEIDNFFEISNFIPRIYAMEDTCITIPDDILINMAIESSRGMDRHGSCGMGINECDLRKKAGYGINLRKLKNMSEEDLVKELSTIRIIYTKRRLKEVEDIINNNANYYLELLSNDNVIRNAANIIIANLNYINVISESMLKDMLNKDIDALIFESGQGLLLDCNNTEYSPNVTASNTGLKNSYEFIQKLGYKIDEVVYVSRTYITRHGAGKLPNECTKEELGQIEKDITNEPNLWQGEIRYAKHENIDKFVLEVNKDLSKFNLKDAKVSLFLTHLNETKNSVVMNDDNISIDKLVNFPIIKQTFNKIYLSSNRFSKDVKISFLNN